jgi:hypothetical protein
VAISVNKIITDKAVAIAPILWYTNCVPPDCGYCRLGATPL